MIKIRQTLSARAIRQVTAVQVMEPRPDTVRKLQERYRFLKVPSSYEKLFPKEPAQGLQFHNGTLATEDGKPPISFDLLHLLPNLILVQTRTSTDDAEAVLADYIQRANKERPDTIQALGPVVFHK